MLDVIAALVMQSADVPFPTRHSATVEDSVRVRTFVGDWKGATIAVSPDAMSVAYTVVEPSFEKNFNETVLYVRSLPTGAERGSSRSNGTAVLRTRGVTQLQWQGDGKHLLVLHRPDGKTGSVLRVDARSGAIAATHADGLNITDFAATPDGTRLVLLASMKDRANVERFASQQGVVITDEDFFVDIETQNSLDVLLVADTGGGAVTVFSGKRGVRLRSPGISADGRFATFYAFGEALPYAETWRKDPGFDRWRDSNAAFPPSELILAELPETLAGTAPHEQMHNRIPLRFAVDVAGIRNPPLVRWSSDSATFLVRTPYAVGDGKSFSEEPGAYQRPEHLFSVDARTGDVQLVMKDPPKEVLAFDAEGKRAMVLLASGELLALRKSSDKKQPWREAQRSKLPVAGVRRVQMVGREGRYWLGVRETTSMPPDLWLWDADARTHSVLTDINPELRQQFLGRVERIEWTDRYGTQNWGHLIYPVGYIEGTRYPAVILSKDWDESFIHGAQVYSSNFPPQALASAGFVVLMRTNLPSNRHERRAALPHLPGGLHEPQGEMEGFESARRLLNERGLIDPARVGLMGFSRSSWQVDYTLTHSQEPWAAAVSADSGIYNYGMFALNRNGRRTMAVMYGGPPAGDTLKVWLNHAPGFLAHRVNTPLLMQYHGHMWDAAEFYTGLRDLRKPVELIFFPRGAHILELPSERLASMQQTLDWFRFWLQGYERPAVDEDPGRYARWRELRNAALSARTDTTPAQDRKHETSQPAT